jgi:Tfp pilus assembly protein PilX
MTKSTRDHGSVSIMVAICLVAVVMFIGLSVDGSGQLRDSQLAQEYAAEAARAGGQKIDLQSAIAGNPAVLDSTPPCPACPLPYVKAVNDYLRSAAAEDGVTIDNVTVVAQNSQTLTVTLTLDYAPRLLNIFGYTKPLQATGTATVDLVTTL